MKNVLIVDDATVVRKFTRDIFIALGFHVTEAPNGQQALDLCRKELPDIIMLDWNMPVMNGLEFLISMRKEKNGDKPIVIFCTTENEIGKIETALTAGANEYIMKPFDADIVKSKLIQLKVL